MKATVLKYGFIGGVILIFFSGMGWYLGGEMSFAMREVIGYASMIMSSFVVFFGIKHHRDHFGNGRITFKKSMQTGLAIMIIPSLLFGFFDMIYVVFIDPNFAESYYSDMLHLAQKNLSHDDYKVFAKKMESQKAMFSGGLGVFFTFLVMTVTVYLIGVITTVFSGMVLRK